MSDPVGLVDSLPQLGEGVVGAEESGPESVSKEVVVLEVQARVELRRECVVTV